MRGGVRRRLVTEGGWKEQEEMMKKPERNEDKGLDNKEWTQLNTLNRKTQPSVLKRQKPSKQIVVSTKQNNF